MKLNYCHICGGELLKKADYFICRKCSQHLYQNPKPCVEIAIFNKEGQLLLSKRGVEPQKGKYDLPGGFVDINDSSLEDALAREIKEELDTDISTLKNLNFVLSYSADYPYGNDTYKTLISAFVANTNMTKFTAKDDVEELKWFYPSEINPKDLSINKLAGVLDKLVEYNNKKGER